MRLTDAGNTHGPAILVLLAKGYVVRQEYHTPSESLLWWAIKDGREFVADTPVTVLGLVALWENRGDEWGKRQGEPSYFELTDQIEYVEVEDRCDDDDE